MQCTCVEPSAFIMYPHLFSQVFPLICHPSVAAIKVEEESFCLMDIRTCQIATGTTE